MVEIYDWLGLVTNSSPVSSGNDPSKGEATVQVNITSVKRGDLQVRLGMRELTFDTET